MATWAGIALALRAPDEDALYSRLPTYFHPLAGRSVAWHLLSALAAVRPKPITKLLVTREAVDPAIVGELDVDIVDTEGEPWWVRVAGRVPPEVENFLILDAAAATLATSLGRFVAGPTGRALIGEHGEPLALWLSREEAKSRVRATSEAPTLGQLAAGLEHVAVAPSEAILIRDREALARASVIIRDRVVENLLAAGVTFLLPETVLVDVDVRIGADTVIYPGVVLEGRTTIGSETVIGPGCRIIDSWIGSGVELKGWNYIAGANVRNRAVLEPYVRRGFD